MRYIKFIIFLALLGFVPCAGATVTVSGNLQNLGVQNVSASGTYVQFSLRNFGAQIPRVSGTSIIVTPDQNFVPDSSGNISGTLYGNNEITPNGTFYQVCVWYQNRQFRCNSYIINPPSFNLNTATPMSTGAPLSATTQVTQSFAFTQTPAATTWTILHNFGTQQVLVEFFDVNGKLIFPDTVTLTDVNTVTATFVTAQAGSANVLRVSNINIVSPTTGVLLTNPTTNQSILGGFGFSNIGGGSFTATKFNSASANIAASGVTNLSSTDSGPCWRNAANTADLCLNKNASDVLFFGTKQLGISSGIRYADQFAGSDAGLQIAAAIADLPATGGTVDARGYGGSTQTISAQLVLGSATKPVTLLVSQQTTFNITVTGGVDAIQVPNGSAIVSDGLGEQLGGVGARFQLASTANVSSIITNADHTGAQEFIYLRGLVLRGNALATMTSAALDLQGIFTNSVVRDVYTEVIAGKALRLRPGASALKVISDIMFDNDNFDCTAAAGGIPVSIESAAASEISGITFMGGAIQHAGSGQSLLVINGAGVSGGTGAHNIQFYGTHFETSTGGASSAITIADASHIVFYDLAFSGPAATNVINISQTVSNASHDIEIFHLRTSTAWTNTVNNAVNSTTVTADVGHYYFGGGAGGAGGAGQITYDVIPVFRSGISGTAGQALGLPASASTLAALGVAQTWTANQTNVPLVTPTIGGGSTFTRFNQITTSLTCSLINANTASTQSFTVTGVQAADKVVAVWNAQQSGNFSYNAYRATALNTVAIDFANNSAVNATPSCGSVTFLLFQ